MPFRSVGRLAWLCVGWGWAWNGWEILDFVLEKFKIIEIFSLEKFKISILWDLKGIKEFKGFKKRAKLKNL